MPTATLVAGLAMTIAEGLGYLAAGLFLRRRHVSDDHRLAAGLFVLWWTLAGANKLVAGLVGLGAGFGLVGAAAYVAVLQVSLLVVGVSVACLLGYFTLLFTGRLGSLVVGIGVGAALFTVLTYSLAASDPVAVGLGTWRTYHVSASSAPPLVGILAMALLVLPPVVAGLMLFRLSLRLDDTTQRWRASLVAWSIVAWTLGVQLVATPWFAESAFLQVGSRVVGLAAAAASVIAYRPPAWAQRRFGVGASAS